MNTALQDRLAGYDRLTRGLFAFAPVGTLCRVETTPPVAGEVLGFRGGIHLVMLYGKADGISPGTRVTLVPHAPPRPTDDWLGRIVDGFGQPLDQSQLGALDIGRAPVTLHGDPPRATECRAVGPRLETGTHVFNTFLPLCQGQRLGLFAGSGVGKSSLLAALAERATIDVAVIGMLDGHVVLDREIAERGRYPAIDVLRSISRSLPHCASDAENALVINARKRMTLHREMEPMLRLGAYRRGTDPETDTAIATHDPLEGFLANGDARPSIAESFGLLNVILQQTGAPTPSLARHPRTTGG